MKNGFEAICLITTLNQIHPKPYRIVISSGSLCIPHLVCRSLLLALSYLNPQTISTLYLGANASLVYAACILHSDITPPTYLQRI